jgi:exodeoxyribonuclease VII large subunit
MQKVDHLSSRLDRGLQSWCERRRAKLAELGAKISPRTLLNKIMDAQRHIKNFAERLVNTETKILKDRATRLENLSGMLESLSFKKVLERGYAVVRDAGGDIISSAGKAAKNQDLVIQFKDGETPVTTRK